VRLANRDPYAFDNPILRGKLPTRSPATYWRSGGMSVFDRTGRETRLSFSAADVLRGWDQDPRGWLTAGLRQVEGGKSYIVEHTSVNPVHPLHLAAARGSLVGHALITLLRFAGADVSARYFVNDLGKQVRFAAWIADRVRWERIPPHVRYDEAVGILYAFVNMYHGNRARDLVLLEQRFPWIAEVVRLDRTHEGDSLEAHLARAATSNFQAEIPKMLAHAASDLARIGAKIDEWEFESRAEYIAGADDLPRVAGLRVVTINGMICLASRAGVVPVQRTDGRSTYFLRDFANFMRRPQSAHVIHVIGVDQNLLQSTLHTVAGAYDRSVEHVSIGPVRVAGRKSSARQARLLTFSDAVRHGGPDGLRDLMLSILLRRRTVEMDIALAMAPRQLRVILEAEQRMSDYRATRYRSAVAEPDLEVLCLRVPGILAAALRSRHVHPVARALVAVSRAYVLADRSQSVHPATHAAFTHVFETLAIACGRHEYKETM
jgi:hypothetical protein